MIDLYTWDTSNGRKVAILLEETGQAYRVVPVDISKGQQHDARFRALNPYAKIPAIVDHAPLHDDSGQPLVLFESGAIMLYLCEKTGQLQPKQPRARFECLPWLMFGLASAGPVLAEVHHYNRHARAASPYGVERGAAEADKVYKVLDDRLGIAEYLCGDGYSVADIAVYPWIARHDWQQIDLHRYPNVLRWYETISARPAVQRGMNAARINP